MQHFHDKCCDEVKANTKHYKAKDKSDQRESKLRIEKYWNGLNLREANVNLAAQRLEMRRHLFKQNINNNVLKEREEKGAEKRKELIMLLHQCLPGIHHIALI